MNAKMFRMLRSALALLLAFSMVVGYVPAAVFATTDGEPSVGVPGIPAPDIKFVSLGDSMTNGYGLEGYNHNSGVEDYGTGS